MYADSIPKEDKALFNFAPVEYIKNREFKKRGNPNIKEIYKDGKSKTFDISKDGQLTEFLNLTNNEDWTTIAPKDKGANFVNFKDQASDEVRVFDVNNDDDLKLLEEFKNEPGREVIRVPGMDKSSDLEKTNKTNLQKTIIKQTDLLSNLERQGIQFDDEFLSLKGKAYYQFLLKKDQAASFTGIDLTTKERGFLNRRARWLQTNQQYFNDYRKAVTGVAAGEKEIGWIQNQFLAIKIHHQLTEQNLLIKKLFKKN